MEKQITTIAFDADDTLWVNEPYFREADEQFCTLLSDFIPKEELMTKLYKTEMRNLPLYGYGIKGFMLSMIETANFVSQGKVEADIIDKIIGLGHNLLKKPIKILDGVEKTLEQTNGNYRLILATKGDLLDQERKLKKSNLAHYFDHIEIMSDKKEENYRRLLSHINCRPENFLMLGNSIKSDVLPVIKLEAYAAHIPYHTTWIHEHADVETDSDSFLELKRIDEILNYL